VYVAKFQVVVRHVRDLCVTLLLAEMSGEHSAVLKSFGIEYTFSTDKDIKIK
jgi:hypothetical protein